MQNNKLSRETESLTPVPEKIKPEAIEKKLYAKKRGNISVHRRVLSAAAAVAIVAAGTGVYLSGVGRNDKDEFIRKTDEYSYNDSAKDNDSKTDSSKSDSSSKSNNGGVKGSAAPVKLTGLKNLSYDELYDLLESTGSVSGSVVYGGNREIAFNSVDGMVAEEAVPDGAAAPATGVSANKGGDDEKGSDYSETYTQEDGIDEADIIKTNGRDIFYVTNGRLYAIKCDNGKMDGSKIDLEKLYGEDFANSRVNEIYLDGDTLTCIFSNQDPYYYTCWAYNDDAKELENVKKFVPTVTSVSFDVEDLGNIKEINRFSLQGYYNDSRMVDGRLYLTSNGSIMAYDTYEKGGTPEFAPIYSVNGENNYVASGDIYVPDGCKELHSYTTAAVCDMTGENAPESVKSVFTGWGSGIYQTADRMFIYGSFYYYDDDSGDDWYMGNTKTVFVEFDTSDGGLTPLAGTTLDGTVYDRYALSYKNGIFYAALNEEHYDEKTYEYLQDNYLYTFDDTLTQLGKTESFGKNEEIKSVYYQDGYAYVVTFMQTDPLFAIDLSDPKAPAIVSELKMPGFSTHMRAFKEGRVIGFGNTAEEEHGWTTGVKVSMFDNSDPENVKELDKVEIEYSFEDYDDDEYSYFYFSSNACYDEKALLIDADRNIIAFPYEKCEDSKKFNDNGEGYYYSERESGYLFYSYTDGEGFKKLGSFDNKYSWRSDTEKDEGEDLDFIRAMYIGDEYYLFFNGGVVSVDSSFNEIDRVTFENENPAPYYDGGLIMID